MKYLLPILTLLSFTMLEAQDKDLTKAKTAMQSKQWARAQSIAEAVVEDDKTAVEFWYIKAAAEFEMSQMEKYRGGKINYFKESTKSAVKARTKDINGKHYDSYARWMKGITVQNNKDAMAAYAQNSYAKAIQLYKNSYLLTGDTIAYGMLGLSYTKDRQEREGLKILKTVSSWNFGAFSAQNCTGTYMREPFEILSNYYLGKGFYDSALSYTEMGLQVYPSNIILKNNIRTLINKDLSSAAKQGLNSEYLEVINRALNYFPSDTTYLLAQNNYYLNKLSTLTKNKPWNEAADMLNQFYRMKRDAVVKGVANPADAFLLKDSTAFYYQCLDYFLRRSSPGSIAFHFKKWYASQKGIPAVDEPVIESLLKSPPKTISRKLISILFADAREDYPKNKNISQYRLDFFTAWTAKPVKAAETYLQLEMCEALVTDFPKDKILPATRMKLLFQCTDSAIKDENMYAAWRYLNRLETLNPEAAAFDKLHQRVAEKDFKIRYYETRILYQTKNGVKRAATGWDGNSNLCKAGSLPDSTLYKVIDRINYFRQNAGVKQPLALSMDKVKKCQEAAVMFAPIGIFTREPKTETHQCYTRNAAEAAANAQAILEANPAQCVTIFMDDRKSDEMVNRRSILNPGSRYAGFGSAENNSVFWLLDLAPTEDSAWYKTHFIAWPNRYCPKMLTMDKWTFSMDAPLQGADVKVFDENNTEIPTIVFYQPAGQFNLPLLSFRPAADLGDKKPGTRWQVKITLKNKKTFQYSVTVI
jgi:tetratricopeptide (TPR) repeat protein